MTDFETVRQRIQGQNGVLAASALAALDRIEAEVERLQRLVAAYEDIELVKEVERLRRELKRRDIEDEYRQPSKAEREIERLRHEVNVLETDRDFHKELAERLKLATQPGVYEELSEYQHEVERLQARLREFESVNHANFLNATEPLEEG